MRLPRAILVNTRCPFVALGQSCYYTLYQFLSCGSGKLHEMVSPAPSSRLSEDLNLASVQEIANLPVMKDMS
jgi:hypothetical protein